MNVYILTEGNGAIGYGHIMRCLSICQAFEEIGVNPIFVVNGDDAVENLLEHRHHFVYDWLVDTQRMYKDVQSGDVLIIDSLLITDDILQSIYEKTTCVVFIDDFIRRKHRNGFVIDWTVYTDQDYYPEKMNGIDYLTGARYAALRKEFWNADGYIIKPDIKNILLTLGGGDLRNLAPKILSMLNKAYRNVRKTVIIGKGFSDILEIEDVADNTNNLVYFPDAKEMIKHMLAADIALSAGGQTLYELARIGVPTIAILVIDNQTYDVMGWHKTGFVDSAGWWNDSNLFENIDLLLQKNKSYDVRLQKYAIAKKYIDGQGAKRIVKALIGFCSK